MQRTTKQPRRRWMQIAASIPNREKEEERRQDLERFHAEVGDEKEWIVKRLDDVDALIGQLTRETETIRESLDRPRRERVSSLSPLTEAGKQHLSRKRLLRYSAELDALLLEVHRHPVFRDIVADMQNLTVPETTLPVENESSVVASRKMLSIRDQLSDLLDNLYRLRRRLRRELLRLAR